jgi:hypothetical protein
MNNNYNPMTPLEDSLHKFQWSVHSIKRCSGLFKTLINDNWSCAGAISPNKDITTINEFSLAFYWRKLLPPKTPLPENNPLDIVFNYNAPSCCSTPAQEVEENILVDHYDEFEVDDSDTEMNTDTFFDSFNNNNK